MGKLPGLNALTEVPKRKPVPMPVDATHENSTTAMPALPAWTQLSRKKRLIIAIVFSVVCLLVLIIGLAAGLTVGR